MAAVIIDAVRVYLIAGGGVAAVFLCWGVGRIEANARDAFAFRPLIAPGVVLLWPLVLWRWRVVLRGENGGARHRPPRRAQDRIAVALALALPLVLTLGVLVRQNGPLERAPVRLAAPEIAR